MLIVKRIANWFGREWIRPWKMASFGTAMLVLLYGAMNLQIADWDVGITLLMGSLAYLLAPWCVSTIIRSLRHRGLHWMIHLALAVAGSWFVVDGVYWAYHSMAGNTMFRKENLVLSSVVFCAAGFLWSYPGSLTELFWDLRCWLRPDWSSIRHR